MLDLPHQICCFYCLPISLNSNSIILVAEAKIFTTLLHLSLPHNSQSVYQEILWALPSKHILNLCTSYHFYIDYPAPAILIISLTVDSQPSSQNDAFKCKSSYITPLLKTLQWLAKCPYGNPQGLYDLVPLPFTLSFIVLIHDYFIPATQASLLNIPWPC